MIAYSLDTFEDLNGYVLLQGHDGYDDFSRTEDSFTKFCGVVRDIKYNYPSAKRNMWVTTLYAGHESDSSASSSFDIIKSNPAPIFLIEENTCSKITVDDIQYGDRIFVAAAVDSVRAVAVKR